MSERLYHNHYADSRGSIVEYNGIGHKVKKAVLNGFNNFNKAVNRLVKRAGNERFKNKLLDRSIPKVYREAAKMPVNESKIVFVEIRHPNITNSFQVVFDELTNNYDFIIHTHFLLNGNTIRPDYAKRVLNAVQDIATAKYVFLNEGSNAISAIPLRPETKIIQLWHGCGAFKRFGFSTADLIFGASRKEQLRHPFNKNYSLVTVSSPEVVWAFKEAMNMPEESEIVQPIGSSRTDVFYDPEFISAAYENVYYYVPQARGKKIILYAPTFRGRVAKAKPPRRLSVKMFYEELGDDYVLLIKHHPVVKKLPNIAEEYSDFCVDVTKTLSIEDLICVSDICISDYSSLVFEYSLFEKPLIFFAYDLDNYFDWRGFYYDYYELAPGLIAKTNFEMIDYIKHIDERFDKQAVKDFRYKFMRSCDGHATQRILEYAIDNLEEHKKPCEKFEHFYTVPAVQSSTFSYFRKINAIAEEKEYATPLYEKYSKEPIIEGSIIAFDIHSKEVIYLLEKAGNANLSIINGGESFDSVIKKIAQANFVFIDQPNTFIDSLDIRPETKVIYLPENAFPLKAFGKITKEYRSGLKKEQYELAPLFKNVSAVVCPSEDTAELYRGAFGEGVEMLVIGDVLSDILLDRNYKVSILDEFYEKYPETEGKRIIAYFGDNREKDPNLKKAMFYEYLSKDFIILTYYKEFIPVTEDAEAVVDYYSNFIIDVTEQLSLYDTLTIADMVVGNFDSALYSFMVTKKPIFVYSPDSFFEIPKIEAFMDIKENCPSPIYEDSDELIDAIVNFKNYNYKKYKKLRKQYLELCDGKSTERLFGCLSTETE